MQVVQCRFTNKAFPLENSMKIHKVLGAQVFQNVLLEPLMIDHWKYLLMIWTPSTNFTMCKFEV